MQAPHQYYYIICNSLPMSLYHVIVCPII